MNQRVEDKDSFDDFPSPPWSVRALMERVLWPSAQENMKNSTVWEPACGRAIMSDVIGEYAGKVIATDVLNYRHPNQQMTCDYLQTEPPEPYAWMITNPPFKSALKFTLKALSEARQGVAILVRSNWVETSGRYNDLFSIRPPAIIAPFVERVPMVQGRWDPKISTATSYSWFVWDCETSHSADKAPKVVWIPPGTKATLTKPTDIEEFASR